MPTLHPVKILAGDDPFGDAVQLLHRPVLIGQQRLRVSPDAPPRRGAGVVGGAHQQRQILLAGNRGVDDERRRPAALDQVQVEGGAVPAAHRGPFSRRVVRRDVGQQAAVVVKRRVGGADAQVALAAVGAGQAGQAAAASSRDRPALPQHRGGNAGWAARRPSSRTCQRDGPARDECGLCLIHRHRAGGSRDAARPSGWVGSRLRCRWPVPAGRSCTQSRTTAS
jgi:hypothetical protein